MMGSKNTNGPMMRCCDSCRKQGVFVICVTESLFLCMQCDDKLHVASPYATKPAAPRHHRMWACLVCERRPATVLCEADMAVLCQECDSDTHSSSLRPLAVCHARRPISPAIESSTAMAIASLCSSSGHHPYATAPEPAASFVEIDLLDGIDFDSLDFLDAIPALEETHQPPLIASPMVKIGAMEAEAVPATSNSRPDHFPHFHYPEGSTTSFGTNTEPVPGPIHAAGTSNHMAREVERKEKVLKYKEKRKTRNFGKTVRYASRKEYAESRPRVKGRFTKQEVPYLDHHDPHIDHPCTLVMDASNLDIFIGSAPSPYGLLNTIL